MCVGRGGHLCPLYLLMIHVRVLSLSQISHMHINVFFTVSRYYTHSQMLIRRRCLMYHTLNHLHHHHHRHHVKRLSSSRYPVKSVRETLIRAFEEVIDGEHAADVTTSSKGADYQCNSAFRMAKKLRKSPKDVARQLSERVHAKYPEMVEIAEVSGPGFVNVRLKSSWIRDAATCVIQNANRECGGLEVKSENKGSVLIDFASPNMSKELHVGHLRSSVIGDTLSRIFASRGHRVERVSHVGDWGPPIAMVIEELRDTYSLPFDQLKLSARTLGEAYVRAKEKMKDLNFQTRVSQTLLELHCSNPEDVKKIGSTRHAWHVVCETSRNECENIFRRLDVSVNERGESTYEVYVESMISSLRDANMIETLENGALQVRWAAENDDDDNDDDMVNERKAMVIRRSDGTSLYSTIDLTAIQERLQQGGHDRIIYVTDHSQSSHFESVFRVASEMNWCRNTTSMEHCACGLVKGEDNRKLSSRRGDAPSLGMLLDDVKASASSHISSTISKNEDDDDLAEIVMCGAVRYWELSHHRRSDYTFSPTKMFDSSGNTSIAMIYACARIRSLRQNAGSSWPNSVNEATESLHLGGDRERAVLLTIAQYPDILDQVARDLTPHLLCEYLHKLTSDFHSFYSNDKILGSEHETSRLSLCVGVDEVLRSGLTLLGVPVPRGRL